jgi:hypothetical protein
MWIAVHHALVKTTDLRVSRSAAGENRLPVLHHVHDDPAAAGPLVEAAVKAAESPGSQWALANHDPPNRPP